MTTEKLLDAIGNINSEAIRAAKKGALEISNPKQRASGHRLATILIAAVLLMALTVSALAYFGTGDWFKSFFAERSGGNLSPGQQQYIDEKTVGIGQSATYDGWTVTVESAICDKYHTYIKVNIEAPEGTVLEESAYFFESDSLSRAEPVDTSRYEILSSGVGWEPLDDGDGKSNTISIMRTSKVTVASGSDFSYADGDARILRLENFCVWQDDDELVQKEVVLAEGVWSFEFVFVENNDTETDEIELISKPILCQGQRMMGNNVEVKMTSFRLNALGAVCEYGFIGDDKPEALSFEGVQAVMKDGSVIELRPAAAGLIAETNIANSNFKFDAPIVLVEVDHIMFPNDVIFPVSN